MGSTKQRICETAVALFNEQGFDAVSLRDIAREAGTTIGNLTYHFPQKNDLLAQLLTDLHAGYSEQLDARLQGIELLERLVDLFAEAQRNQRKYPFYFKNLNEIVRLSAAVGDESRRFQRDLCGFFRESLLKLKDGGFIRAELGAHDLELLAFSMTCLVSSWSMGSAPHANDLMDDIGIAEALCSLLRAHLAEKCLPLFAELCAQAGV